MTVVPLRPAHPEDAEHAVTIGWRLARCPQLSTEHIIALTYSCTAVCAQLPSHRGDWASGLRFGCAIRDSNPEPAEYRKSGSERASRSHLDRR